MKRLELATCAIVGALAVLLGLYHPPEEGLSIRLVHPRSSQLIQTIESGQTVVPPTYEVMEMDAISPNPEDRLLVSCTEELSGKDFTGVEVTRSASGEDIYLGLTDEGVAELYDLAEDYPNRQFVIVTEDGAVMPIQRVRRNLKESRLAIHLDPKAKQAEVQELAAELRKDI